MAVLVTGGAGYIGSHTCVELLEKGYQVIAVDNFSNSYPEVIKKIEITSEKKIKFYQIDLLDKEQLNNIFRQNKIEKVIHFAAFKSVSESELAPLSYYNNNLIATINLLEVMAANNVKKLVFSSSAAVYGKTKDLPIKEDSPLLTTNPYGKTKFMAEEILQDVFKADKKWNIIILRYFNPVGSHEKGLLAENPLGDPENLFPRLVQVAKGKEAYLKVYGDDYQTPDGTGIRDYLHVVDLASGHLKALERLSFKKGLDIYNLGKGFGYSVLEVIKTFEKVHKVEIPYKIANRRIGDIDMSFADPSKAINELNWEANRDLEEMCKSAWPNKKKSKI